MNWYQNLTPEEMLEARQRMDGRAKMQAMKYERYAYPYYADITPAFERFMSEIVSNLVCLNYCCTEV
jgi:hypothetical protein